MVAGVRDDQLTGPTPCTGTSVAALLDHFDGLTPAFRQAAEKIRPAGGPSADAAHLVPDWRTRIPEQLQALAAAWAQPGSHRGADRDRRHAHARRGHVCRRAERGARSTAGTSPWRPGRTTGPTRSSAQACLEFGQGLAVGAPEVRDAMYGPVVPVPDDAPVFDRLLGQAGRDPGWTAA